MSARMTSGFPLPRLVLVLLPLLGACRSIAVDSAASASAPTHREAMQPGPQRLTQLYFGRQAVYATCWEPGCPTVTRKTLPAVAAESTTEAASGIAAASAAQSFSRLTTSGVETPTPPPGSDARQRIAVNFDSGSAALSATARATLERALPLLQRSNRILIAGRTDSAGSAQVNAALARDRASAVRDYLRRRASDLAPETIAVDAEGACCFVADNASAEGRSKNRRAEIVFVLRG